MALQLIVKGFHNKHYVRDFFIDLVTLGRRFHESLSISEFVFNRNTLEINGPGEGAYFIRLNNNIDKRVLTDLFKQNLINDNEDVEKDFKFVTFDNWEYQNLFLGWQGFMF